jgi:hypothetical protein
MDVSIFADLVPFQGLIKAIVNDINVHKRNRNYEHYDRTIRRLIEGMLDSEPEQNDDAQNREPKFHQKNTRLTISEVKKALLKQGKYHEIDFKCHSFKSFVHLIRINQLFKELMHEPNKTEDCHDHGADEIADDFISQLRGDTQQNNRIVQSHSVPDFPRRPTLSKKPVNFPKLTMIEEIKETPISNIEAQELLDR